MATYTSQGTIRICCDISNSGSVSTIIFVPEKGYSIKHRNKNYAVFVPRSCKKAVIMKYDPDKGNGVKIRAAELGCTDVISGAATHQTKVEVRVKATLNEDATITAAEKGGVAKEAAKEAKEAAVREFLEAINELEKCIKLELVGITVPAK